MKESSVEPKPKESEVNIRTMIRLRPLLQSQQDEPQSIKYIDNKTIQIKLSGCKKNQQGERIFQSTCTQRDIFDEVISMICKWQQGYNVTVLTYGQTGSGKTYTMFGSDWNNIIKAHNKAKQQTFLRSLEQDQNYAGLIPRTIHHLFTQIQNNKHVKVYCSFIQLYNQQMIDLLDNDNTNIGKKLMIHQNKCDGIYVSGLLEIQISDVDHCLQVMQRGEKNRVVRQTNMNVKSSRSHTLFQLIVEQVFPSTRTYRRMKINLCDLAGSQKINKYEEMDQNHLDQLKNINLSLTTLGRVINNLSTKQKKAPFRQSKLTRLLQDSLGGNTYTSIIATITSKASCLQQSLNTINFLQRAKQIKTTISKKIYNNNSQVKNLQKEITYLKDILKIKKNGIQIDYQIIEKIKKLELQNFKFKQIIDQNLVDRLIKQNTHLKQQLQRKNIQEILDKTKLSSLNRNQSSGGVINNVSYKEEAEIPMSVSKRFAVKNKFMSSSRSLTNKQKSRKSSKQSSRKMLPKLKPKVSKSSSSGILQRIVQIEKRKKQNKLKLENQLLKMGEIIQKKTNLSPIKFKNHQYWKY